MLPLVLLACEMLVFRIKEIVLRRKFGRKKEKLTGSWRKPHNEELHKPNASPNTVRTVNQGG
jgi:hypothetical protein